MRYINCKALPINWVKIGSCPFLSSYNGSFTSPPLGCIINGYYGLFYATSSYNNPPHSLGAVLYLWDENGDRCEYRTSDFVNNNFVGNLVTSSDIYQNGNVIDWSTGDGNRWRINIPTVFTPGAVYVLPVKHQPSISPCGGGTYQRTIYFREQGLYAQEFIQAFPESDNYWASIYSNQGQLLGGGYLGNSPQDLFDRRDLILPPYVHTPNVYLRNGSTIFSTMGSSGWPYQVIGFFENKLNGDYSQLVCGGNGNLNVYATGVNGIQVYPARDLGSPWWYGQSNALAYSITDIPNYFLFCDYQTIFLFSKDYLFGFSAPGEYEGYGFINKTKKLYWNHDTSGKAHYTGDIYIADFPKVAIDPIASASIVHYKGLANYHRAISPDGLFNA